MRVKQVLKRGMVKAHRKIFGKPTDVMITTGKGGLTKSEIKDVLQTLTTARKQGLLSPLTFEYKPPIPILSNREAIFLIPKDGKVLKARIEIRKILKARYGTQFIVNGSKPSPKVEGTRSRQKPLTRKTPRITPIRPKLRR